MDKKRLVVYLLGGVLLVGLLIGGGYIAYWEFTYDDEPSKTIGYNPPPPIDEEGICLNSVSGACDGAKSVNLSSGCRTDEIYAEIEKLNSVASVDQSTGVARCVSADQELDQELSMETKCVLSVARGCRQGISSVNLAPRCPLNEIYREIDRLNSSETLNRSTGVVTCSTSSVNVASYRP